jgi:hypothetical protein
MHFLKPRLPVNLTMALAFEDFAMIWAGFVISMIAGIFLQSITLAILNNLDLNLFWGQIGFLAVSLTLLVFVVVILVRLGNGKGFEGIANVIWAMAVGGGIHLV